MPAAGAASLRGAPSETLKCASNRRAGEGALQLLDRLGQPVDMRVDGERGLEGLERRLLLVEREIDLAEPRQRAEMARLQGERALDIGDARIVIAHDEFDGGALVPALG